MSAAIVHASSSRTLPPLSPAEIYTVMYSVSMAGTGGWCVKVPFTGKVAGWFMIGWSPEFPSARCGR